MGLFSFLKNAGSKVLKNAGAENDAAADAAANAAAADSRTAGVLKNMISGSGIPVENLDVEFSDGTATVYGLTTSVDDKEKVVLMLGNVDGIGAVDDRISVTTPPPTSKFYEVKPGDSLSKIAKEFYGDPMKFNDIFEANKPMLKDPNMIYPGQTLRIPNL